MKKSSKPEIYLALLHYPVVNKRGKVIASAVTNLDLHDMARAARTYGVQAFYVVTPLTDQKELVEQIAAHWTAGVGGTINPARKNALNLIRIKDTMEEVVSEIESFGSGKPGVVVTSARKSEESVGFPFMREKLRDGAPHVLCFGTAWGLTDEFIAEADYLLDPVMGNSDYNHLSVRSAASIILDRLVGRTEDEL